MYYVAVLNGLCHCLILQLLNGIKDPGGIQCGCMHERNSSIGARVNVVSWQSWPWSGHETSINADCGILLSMGTITEFSIASFRAPLHSVARRATA